MTVTILQGDVFEQLATLPDDSVDCVVTSPPYWGLRDYGVEGQIGMEPTLGEHLEVMVRVFEAVKRVLKPTGVFFLNYGDCYATSPNGRSAADTKATGRDDRTFRDKPFSTVGPIFGAPRAREYDSGGTKGSDSQGHDLSFQNRDDARKDFRPIGIFGSDARHVLEQVDEPLSRILERMGSLLDHLPSGDCADLTALRQCADDIRDQEPALTRLLVSVHDVLASTMNEFVEQPPEGSRLLDMISACLSSLRSCALGVQRFAHMSAGFSRTPRCKVGSASPFEELALHIQCTVSCCSLFASSWRDIEARRPGSPVLKPKDLCMVPNRLAIALQESGWWVRSEIIWAKPNPMPDSSGRYRPSTSHEKIFMLVKSKSYFYDSAAVRMDTAASTAGRLSQNTEAQHGSDRANGGTKVNGNMKAVGDTDTRLLRNYEPAPVEVWSIPTAAFSKAHFATFPPALVERCLKAGCPEGGTVLDPFGGAGTTGLVADRLQLNCTLIELNPEYVDIAQRRLDADRGGLLDFMEPAQ